MKTRFEIKNFRVFDQDGAIFNLKPITILTGANSAGKSSLVKGLKMIMDYSRQFDNYYPYPCERLTFQDGKVNIFDIKSVINRKNRGADGIVFSLSFVPFSPFFEYDVEYTFNVDGDKPDGVLRRIRVFCNSELMVDQSFASDGLMEESIEPIPDSLIDAFICNGYEDLYNSFSCELNREAMNRIGFISSDEILRERKELLRNDERFCNTLAMSEECFDALLDHNPLYSQSELIYPALDPWCWPFEDRCKPGLITWLIHHVKTSEDLFFKCLKHYRKDRILTYLPILEVIDSKSPDEIFDYMAGLLSLERGSFKEVALHMLVESFRESGMSSFKDYYRSLERQGFADVGKLRDAQGKSLVCISVPSGGLYRLCPCLDDYLMALDILDKHDEDKYGDVELECDCYLAYSLLSECTLKDSGNLMNEMIMKVDEVDDFDDLYVLSRLHSVLLHEFSLFRSKLIAGLYSSDGLGELKSINSFLTSVRSVYSVYDTNNQMVALLQQSLSLRELYDKEGLRRERANHQGLKYRYEHGAPSSFFDVNEDERPGSFVNRWIQELGVGDELLIDRTDDGAGIRMFVRRGAELVSTADLGHGITQLVSILLSIDNESKSYNTTLCLEEPEISLHPSFQSKLADIFRDAHQRYGLDFIIETHSEYLIRSSQAMVARECETGEDLEKFPFVVYYINENGDAWDLEYSLSGRFKKSFGEGFFDEANRSNIEILMKERRMRDEKKY